METKLEMVRRALRANDPKKAIAIAARFPRLGAWRDAILDAHMAYTNPRFCMALHKDPAALIAAGRIAIFAAFGE